MNLNKKHLIKNLLYVFPTAVYCIYFFAQDYSKLGFFADDSITIFNLSKDLSLKELFILSHNWDAARDLHLIWQKIFINISKPNIIENLHLYQLILYLINSLLFIKILSQLSIRKEIIFFLWILSLFLPVYSEVIFWTHAFSMVLMSSFFFLIFLILSIYSYNKFINLKYEFLILLTLLLTLFTYEQSIFSIFFIIFFNNYFKFKKKYIDKKKFILLISFYFTVLFIFLLYKLNAAGTFNSTVLYHTGSKIGFNYKIIDNILLSFGIFVYSFLDFKINLKNLENNMYNHFIFMGLFLLTSKYLIIDRVFHQNEKKIKYLINALVMCLILFFSSFIPLYFHYLSDRHFYLPSFFMFIGLGFVLEYWSHLIFKKPIFKMIVVLVLFLFISKFMFQYDTKKYQNIENFQMKKIFYNNILKSDKFDQTKSSICLYGFPDLYKNQVLFAHEQEPFLRVLNQNDKLPKILRNPEIKNSGNQIVFLGVVNNEIKYDFRQSD